MNPIQFYYAIGVYTNLTQATRFTFQEINKAVNDSIMNKLDSIIDSDKPSGAIFGLDRIQKFRDELYTLIKTSTTVPTVTTTINDIITVNHINYPIDYQSFAALSCTIDGNTTYGRDTNYSEIGPILNDSFRKPNNKKPYFLEDATGLKLYRGIGGTFSSASLTYIKIPATFYMGNETDLIDAGTGVLVSSRSYTAVEESVHNGIVYITGAQFVSVNTNLTSGQVIPTSVLVDCDLPQKTHDELAKMAASVLLGVTSAFNNSAYVEKETD